jgi:ribonuclease VapC
MFIDTSAVVAILCGEAPADRLSDLIGRADARITAPHVRLESVMVLASRLDLDPAIVQRTFDLFLAEADVAMTSLDDATAGVAVEAFARFGKGRGSKASLNFGDCLSYAAAARAGMPLLFVGDDFNHTDIPKVP